MLLWLPDNLNWCGSLTWHAVDTSSDCFPCTASCICTWIRRVFLKVMMSCSTHVLNKHTCCIRNKPSCHIAVLIYGFFSYCQTLNTPPNTERAFHSSSNTLLSRWGKANIKTMTLTHKWFCLPLQMILHQVNGHFPKKSQLSFHSLQNSWRQKHFLTWYPPPWYMIQGRRQQPKSGEA